MAALPDKAARPVLGGGTRVTRFPTAIATSPPRRAPVKDRTPLLLGRSTGARPATRRGQERRWRRWGHRTPTLGAVPDSVPVVGAAVPPRHSLPRGLSFHVE